MNLRSILLAALLLTACGGGSNSVIAPAKAATATPTTARGNLYETSAALAQVVPVIDHTDQGRAIAVYELYVSNLTADSKPLLMAQFSVTNDNPYTVGIGSAIIDADTWEMISPAVMDNVSPDRHHYPRSFSVVDRRGLARPVRYQLIVYAASVWTNTGHIVRVDAPGYGFLQCLVL